MKLWLAPLMVLALSATTPPQSATASPSVCTPQSGTAPWYFQPGFAIQSDGRILLGGISSFNNVATTAGVRLTVDGAIDTNFSSTIAPLTIDQRQADIVIEPDGNIVMTGGFTVNNGGSEVSRYIARYDGVTGHMDQNLIGNLGAGSITTSPFAIDRQSDGSLIVGGATVVNGINWPRIGRLSTTGSADVSTPSFASNATGEINGHSYDISVDANDRVWVGGGFTGGVRLFAADGTPIPMGTADSTVRSILIRQDNSVLLGGDFTSFTPPGVSALTANRLIALNADGTPDTAFNTNLGTGANGEIRSLSLQDDGKFLIAGAFTEFAGIAVHGVARVNADGTPDTAFNTIAGNQNLFGQSGTTVNKIGSQPDGRIILFGNIQPTDPTHGNLAPGVARLTASGHLDPRFNSDCTNANLVPTLNTNTISPSGQVTVTSPETGIVHLVESASVVTNSSDIAALAPNHVVSIPINSPNTSVATTLPGLSVGAYTLIFEDIYGNLWPGVAGAFTVAFPTPVIPPVAATPPATTTPPESKPVPPTTTPPESEPVPLIAPISDGDLPHTDAVAAVAPTDLGAPATATAGDSIGLTAAGFALNEEVVTFFASQRSILTRTSADANGTVTAVFDVPFDLAGLQTLVMWQPATDTMQIQSITITAAILPATGGSHWAPWSAVLIGLGVLVLLVRRRPKSTFAV